MTPQEQDLLLAGASVGLIAGTWLGYELRGLVERFRGRRLVTGRTSDARVPLQRIPSEREPKRRARAVPNVIPINQEEREHWQRQVIGKPVKVVDQDHDDVVAALVTAGYAKKTAVTAVNACTPDERANVAEWAKAAFKRAAGGS